MAEVDRGSGGKNHGAEVVLGVAIVADASEVTHGGGTAVEVIPRTGMIAADAAAVVIHGTHGIDDEIVAILVTKVDGAFHPPHGVANEATLATAVGVAPHPPRGAGIVATLAIAVGAAPHPPPGVVTEVTLVTTVVGVALHPPPGVVTEATLATAVVAVPHPRILNRLL